MPKANLVLPDGTKVTIDGTTEEVATLLGRISGNPPTAPAVGPAPKRRRATNSPKGLSPGGKAKGPKDYVRDLLADDFFKTKRGLRDVQKKLEEGAHIYAVTHISPALFRLVRDKELRRIKEEGTWRYVNP
jgi:hypothetical protein